MVARMNALLGAAALLLGGCVGGEGASEGATSTEASGASATATATATSGASGETSGGGSSSGGGTTGAPTTSGGPTSGEPTSGGSTTDGPTTDGPTTGGGEACVDDHRVVAFVANWQECPTPAQMAQWSHAVVAFAVTYTWTPNGNVCDESCTIGQVPGCNGRSLAELAADLHAAGVEVLLSFGGAGMGGLWEGTCGQMTKCWDHCLDETQGLADALVSLVADNDLDGIDLDYEYCLHDAAHVDFVGDLTAALRAGLDALPGRKLLTHAPMDSELDAGDPYFGIVDAHAGELDFLMPQYYNGGLSPFEPAGLEAIEAHYRALVDGPFGGDASKMVFGYCIEPGCDPVATQPAAVAVAEVVSAWYPSDGGVFFWAHPNEYDAWFSTPFRALYDRLFCP